MFKRYNRLAIELPTPTNPDANAAAAVQELLGGRFGEMSTLNNYMYQSFNFRKRGKLKPFFDLVSSITAEEFGHVELVSHTINMMIYGTTHPGDVNDAPMAAATDKRNTQHFIGTAQTSFPFDSMGKAWNGDYVFSSGNLLLDLLHNFFLECGARTHKMRVYEMTSNPVAREMIGYLLVRGGVHVLAYAKAIEMVTGVDIKKMLPVPDLENSAFETTRKFEAEGVHRKLYTFSDTDYRDIALIWAGQHPLGGPLETVIGAPEGAPMPELRSISEEFAPGISHEDFMQIAERLKKNAGIS
ncbi:MULTISPECIES: manganese catalase family protein [Fictibacillus]|jgi:Mn-containing catalase|uniref:manganese catalase family protein n=1 Tax=Fictibacillus TaxID=1329200 RepID=UPI0018CD7EE6|nr:MULTISPECIES: manganese catalase family protein [unclassified Fictibacillus]MBH0155093.1 manganese catalase family protein [Fictibacillus sp. 5RED26]MBH0162358.1 manganese catalase family protein [Fictibacillus sp. 26RED30]MBH0165123.1 manganese catalase family protein [Fictibacillus sp. 7GRE50]MBH0172284.1 manganese catalase family protein [Fictibacillus sp. 23RED33]